MPKGRYDVVAATLKFQFGVAIGNLQQALDAIPANKRLKQIIPTNSGGVYLLILEPVDHGNFG